MSAPDNEDLIDYEDDIPIPAATSNGAVHGVADGDDKDKKNFSGIHSTGFRYVIHCCSFYFLMLALGISC